VYNFGKDEWILLNQIAATTNNFIAVNIFIKKSNVFGTFSLWPSSERKIIAVYRALQTENEI